MGIKQTWSAHMLVHDKLQMKLWKPIHLGDEVFKHLAKMKSLEALGVEGAHQSQGQKVAFSEQALISLLQMPKLKFLVISPSNFTKEGLEALKKMNLPVFVEIR